LVTVEVGMLESHEMTSALGRGRALAESYCKAGLIDACALALSGVLDVAGQFDALAITAQTETA